MTIEKFAAQPKRIIWTKALEKRVERLHCIMGVRESEIYYVRLTWFAERLQIDFNQHDADFIAKIPDGIADNPELYKSMAMLYKRIPNDLLTRIFHDIFTENILVRQK
jgi:hypothetical protein